MLLTITTTHQPANELGYLLHKHPERCQSFDMSFGKVHVYYPEVSVEKCTACLLLDVDSVGMVRGKNADQSFLLAQYVNDRPYTASSFLSVAIAQVFGSALRPGSTCFQYVAASDFCEVCSSRWATRSRRYKGHWTSVFPSGAIARTSR